MQGGLGVGSPSVERSGAATQRLWYELQLPPSRSSPCSPCCARSPFVELWARSSLKRSTSIKGAAARCARCAASLPPCLQARRPPNPYSHLLPSSRSACWPHHAGHTKHPRWRETFELPIHVPEHQELVGSASQGGRDGVGGTMRRVKLGVGSLARSRRLTPTHAAGFQLASSTPWCLPLPCHRPRPHRTLFSSTTTGPAPTTRSGARLCGCRTWPPASPPTCGWTSPRVRAWNGGAAWRRSAWRLTHQTDASPWCPAREHLPPTAAHQPHQRASRSWLPTRGPWASASAPRWPPPSPCAAAPRAAAACTSRRAGCNGVAPCVAAAASAFTLGSRPPPT